MKRFPCFLLAMMMLFSCTAMGDDALTDLTEEEIVQEENLDTDSPELLEDLISNPLPVDYSGGFKPVEDFYDGYTAYQDPTIQVQIYYRETNEYTPEYKGRTVGYWVVDVRLGDASQLRTAAAESFTTDTSLPVNDIADRVNAVVAFNADYFSRLKEGFAIRQGVLIRDKLKGQRDVLLIDEDGDFHVSHLPKKGELSETIDGKKVINAFYFGPILVENGEVPKKLPNFTYLKPEKYYARLALCQVGPLHYKVILTTMEQDYILGLQLPDFAELCQAEGAQIAYNLDGGLSTTLYFNHKRLNEQHKVNFRSVPDIFYFASAWNGEE